MLTAAMRGLHGLHGAHPGRYVTDVRTSAGQLCLGNRRDGLPVDAGSF